MKNRIFKTRIIKSIKGKNTITPYEKSRLVVQAFNDQDKDMILTQSPIVQRISVRLPLSISIFLMQNYGLKLILRDVQQAHIQSKTPSIRELPYWSSPEIIETMNLPDKTVMRILKCLYGIPESGNH